MGTRLAGALARGARGARVAAATLAGAALAVSASPASGASARARARVVRVSPAGPCGRAVAHPSYTHVIWVVMENAPYSAVIGSPSAPYTNALARSCGLAANDQAVTHPSLPNYLALTAGTTFGVADDADPSAHPLRAASIFSQVGARHLSWRSYEESMRQPCAQVSTGLYAVKHNPAAYYVPLRAQCDRFDVPMGPMRTGALARALASKAFPSFAFVTPNVCDDGHSCPLSTADAWLRQLVGVVTASPTYRAGHLVLFVTWDEGIAFDQRVPLVAVAPSVPRGTLATAAFDHYSLLRTTEQLLRLAPLGRAAGVASMVGPFHL